MYSFIKSFITFFFTLSISFLSFGQSSQDHQRDSLLHLVSQTSEDTLQTDYYLQLAKMYMFSNPEEALKYIKSSLILSKKSEYNNGIINSHKKLFNAYLLHGTHRDSLYKTTQQLENHLINTNQHPKLYITYAMYGIYFSQSGEIDKAIQAYLDAIKALRKDTKLNELRKQYKEAGYLNNIGIVLYKNGQYSKALQYYKKALALAKEEKQASILYNAGMIYDDNLNQRDTAILYFDKAYELFKKQNNLRGIVSILSTKAGFHDEKKQFERAHQLYQKALKITNENHLGFNAYFLHNSIAQHYALRNLHNDAIIYGEKALQLAKDQGNLLFMDGAYNLLRQSYAETGNYSKAYQASINLMNIKDSISNTELKAKVEELQTQFDVEQTEIENNLLKAKTVTSQKTIQNRNITSLTLFLVLLLLGSWAIVVFRNNRQKQKYNKELQETVLERTSQLRAANAHLEQANYELKTFNYIASHDIKEPIRNIGSYAGLIFRKLPTNLQSDFQTYFDIIKNSSKQLYTLIEDFSKYTQMSRNDEIEIQSVNLNVLIDSLEMSISALIQEKNAKIINQGFPPIQTSSAFLYTIIKNIVENGLKFNQSPVPTVTLFYQKNDNLHEIHINDNGIGIEEVYQTQIFEMFKRLNNRNEYQGSGIGLAIVKLLAEKIEGNIQLNSEPHKGSTFIIQLPIKP